MSSIGGVGSAYSSSGFSPAQGTHGGRRGHGPQQLENDLASYLTQQGVSSSEQTQILSEVKSGLSAQRTSFSARPDHSQLLNTVSSVLQSHGLDGDKFSQSIQSALVRSGAKPPPPTSSSDKDSQDALQQLLDLLAKAWKKALKQSDPGNGSDSSSSSTATSNIANGNSSTNANLESVKTSDANSPYQVSIELSTGQGELNLLV